MAIRKKRITKKRRVGRKNNKLYRRNVATMARPLNVKPRSALQNVTYYNSFLCRPKADTSGSGGPVQKNFHFVMNLNSIWPFDTNFDQYATDNGQVFTPNASITPYATPVTDAMTTMPNVRDGANLFSQYSKCCVVGTKVTLVATPIKNNTDIQLGYLYAIKHSQPGTGLDSSSNIVDIQKLPYRQMAKLAGPDAPTSGFQSGQKVGAKIIVKHSPKRFNNVKDLRDNNTLFNSTGNNTVAHKPGEADYLTVGAIPALNGLGEQVTDFCLQVRVEQKLLWTEPLEALVGASAGQGNYSFPWAALSGAAAITGAGMYM